MMKSQLMVAVITAYLLWPSSGKRVHDSRNFRGYGSLIRVRRKAADSTQLWPDGVVPFAFLEPEPSRSIVISGLTHWQEHTCIKFTPVNNTDYPHLQFRRLSGCRSGVGVEGSSGQNISIGDNCNKLGIVVHEIGHALGFYHEIRRPDRDEHVVINEENILRTELFNFYKLHWLDVSIKYDLSSVMHYNPLEWSSNERTTVATKDPMLQGLIGRWKQESDLGLSHRDKLLANTIYKCLDQWLEKCNLNRNPCNNEGYLGENCTCVCPPGTTGRTCETVIGDYYDNMRSSCSQDVTYPTYITTPNYPHSYDADTWCVFRLQGEECQAPEVVIMDFQLGPRSFRDQCFHDYLEVRNNSLYNGFIKCGTDVARGTRWVSSSSTMILYFKGSEGGHRGFKAQVLFNPMPGCCRTHANSSAFFFHTPGYPNPYSTDFNCSYSLKPNAPARVVVTVSIVGGSRSADPWTCALQLCQPNGRCYKHCKEAIQTRSRKKFAKEVSLPNVASIHYLQYSNDHSPFRIENAAYQIGFTLEESPCHKVIVVNRTEPRGWIVVSPRFFELLQCEWWIEAPRGSHVRVTIKDLHLPFHDESYLAINEAGDPSYPKETTRVYHDFNETPRVFVSLAYKLSLVLQGDFITEVAFKYELYECVDLDEECEYWAANGECKKNPYWMKRYCKQSCRECEYSTVCEDEHPECEFWATHEQCDENKLWMLAHCKKSCGYCDLCWDANLQCEEWADMGECEGNPEYMSQFCRKSCRHCVEPLITTEAMSNATLTSEITLDPSPGVSNTTDQNNNEVDGDLSEEPSDKIPRSSRSKDPNRSSKNDNINQTFKPSKNKYRKGYRNKQLKPSQDRFNRYKQNNVMLPPYDDEDDEEEDNEVASYSKNRLHHHFTKDPTLDDPTIPGRVSANRNQKIKNRTLVSDRRVHFNIQYRKRKQLAHKNQTPLAGHTAESNTTFDISATIKKEYPYNEYSGRRQFPVSESPTQKKARPKNHPIGFAKNRKPQDNDDIKAIPNERNTKEGQPLDTDNETKRKDITANSPGNKLTDDSSDSILSWGSFIPTGKKKRKPKIWSKIRRSKYPVTENITAVVASPLIQKQNVAKGINSTRELDSTLSNVDNEIKTPVHEEVPVPENLTSDSNLKQNSSSEMPCDENDISYSCSRILENSHANTSIQVHTNKTELLQESENMYQSVNLITNQRLGHRKDNITMRNKKHKQRKRRKKNKSARKRFQNPQTSGRNNKNRSKVRHEQNLRNNTLRSEERVKNVSLGRRRKQRQKGRGRNRGRPQRPGKKKRRHRGRSHGRTNMRQHGERVGKTHSLNESFSSEAATTVKPNVVTPDQYINSTYDTAVTTTTESASDINTTEQNPYLNQEPTESTTLLHVDLSQTFGNSTTVETGNYTVPEVTENITTVFATPVSVPTEPSSRFIPVASTIATPAPVHSTTTVMPEEVVHTDQVTHNTSDVSYQGAFTNHENTHGNEESNAVSIGMLNNATFPRVKDPSGKNRSTFTRRQKRLRKQRRKQRKYKHKGPFAGPERMRTNNKDKVPRRNKHRWYRKKNRHRNAYTIDNQEDQSTANRKRNTHRTRYKLVNNITSEVPLTNVTLTGSTAINQGLQRVFTTASPPAPSSTTNPPSTESLIMKKDPEVHEMLKTEPESEISHGMQEMPGLHAENKTDSDTSGSKEIQTDVKEALGGEPPLRSPDKYAEWGIGPVKSPHHQMRGRRPGWKFRRSFYMRDHIYEDIWPLLPGGAYGRKR